MDRPQMKDDLNTRPAEYLRIIAFVWRLITHIADYVITSPDHRNHT